MKKHTFLILALLSCAVSASAEHLSPDDALARVWHSPAGKTIKSKENPAKLKLVDSLPEVYMFSGGDGFVVASANDCAPALLGYADEGNPSAEQNPSLKWWLEQYSQQIADAAQKDRTLHAASSATVREPIEPLCPYFWNQGGPFNDSCPLLHGRRCVTGCVATAMCIAMRHHNYPTVGKGTRSYHWQDTTLTFNYGATTFQWDLMPARYNAKSTEAERAAVAQLMYAAGVGVGMFFHPGESAAYINNIEPALRNYFNYSRSMWQPARNYYDLEQWNDLIYSELAASRPVIYFGDGSDGGHEFVCDGYNNGYFHINWGWGGISNGYFSFIDLDPPAIGIGGGDGGFNFHQGAILGIRPPQEGDTPHYIMYSGGGFVADKLSFPADSTVTFTGRYFNRSTIEMPDSSAYGVEITPLDGSEAPFYIVSDKLAGLKSNRAKVGMPVNFSTLPQGEYRISPAFYADGDWERLPTPVNSNGSYVAVVSADSIHLTDPGVPRLSGGKIEMLTPLVYKHNFVCRLPVYNTGYGAFSGTIRPQLLTVDSLKTVANGAELLVDIPANDTVDVRFDGGLTLNARYSTAKPAQGVYVMRFINTGSHQQIGDTLHITLNEPSDTLAYSVTSFSIEGGTTVTDPSHVKFLSEVNCTSGYFTLPVQVAIYRKERRDREEQIRIAKSNNIYIVGGETGAGITNFDLSALGDGDYQARAFIDHKEQTGFMDFKIAEFTDVINVDEDNGAGADEPVYDLYGRRVTNLSPGNLYIRAGHKFIQTE